MGIIYDREFGEMTKPENDNLNSIPHSNGNNQRNGSPSSHCQKDINKNGKQSTQKQVINNLGKDNFNHFGDTIVQKNEKEQIGSIDENDVVKFTPLKSKNSRSTFNLLPTELCEKPEELDEKIDLGLSLPGFETDPYQSNHLTADIDINIKKIFIGRRNTSYSFKSKENIFKKLEDDAISMVTIQNDYELNFYRDGEEIRKSYIAKLICKKVWEPNKKEKTHNSLIIFDWDDTLLCTTFLTPNGVFNEDMKLTEKEKEKVGRLEVCVFKLLSIAVEKGDVFIITNAGPGWVEFSAEKFYPSILPILSKIKVISARGEYETKYPGDSRMWKIQAFLNTQKSFNSELVTNIICLGDSFIEMEAGQTLASKFSQAFFKTVKFRESPKPEELQKQLTLVADQFNSIYIAIKNLTIRVEKKNK